MAKQRERRKPAAAAAPASSTDHQPLGGKAIVITGGTTGIGRATAVLLASRGARVLIFGRHQEELQEALDEIASTGGDGHGLVADQSRQSDIRRIFDTADREIGGVDVLVNNAAVSPDSVMEGAYEDWQYALNTNLLGYIACCREAIDRMKPKGAGHIVNVGSMSADLREEGGDVYVATKAGIQGFSESLRKSVNRLGIRLSLVEPGRVATELGDTSEEKKREKMQAQEMIEPADIAEAIYYCISQPQRVDVVQVQIRPIRQII